MEETNKHKSNTLIAVLLALLVLVLGGILAFNLLKPTELLKKETTTDTKVTTTETKDTGTAENTDEPKTGTTTNTGATQNTKADIDGDLKSIDSIDINSVENDYGEDTLSDL
jgi:hypothetical protein